MSDSYQLIAMKQSTLSFFKKPAAAAVASSSLTSTLTTSLNPCRRWKAELDTDAYKRQQYLSNHHDYDTKKRDRAFKHNWKLNNPWLCYDDEADFCGVVSVLRTDTCSRMKIWGWLMAPTIFANRWLTAMNSSNSYFALVRKWPEKATHWWSILFVNNVNRFIFFL